MNCQDYEDRLGDYVDGTLDAASRARVESHLDACVACRAVVSDFTAIHAISRALEPLAPGPEVWQKIAAATAGSQRRSWWSIAPFGGWHPVLASAMAVMLAAGLWWIGARLSDAAGAVDRTAFVLTEGFDAGQQGAEAEYVTAIARLEQIAIDERSALDQETAYVLDAGLNVIDEAIVESRAALEIQPDSELAQDILFDALRRKVVVLQDMLVLIGEMREGGQGMLSEQNP
jgi:anti-sigma factor RsiW